jgi:tetraprenyl-beta-curcumene synthase
MCLRSPRTAAGHLFSHTVFRTRKAVGVRTHPGRGVALAAGFAKAARSYWVGVFPRVCREVGQWRGRAAAIPDPTLRRVALTNLRVERPNLDGAAAFAAFVPCARRTPVIRAQVALQVAYDYVDTLAEEPCADPIRNGRRLHGVLRAALDPGGPQGDYYVHHAQRDDACYLRDIVEACRVVLRELPSYGLVAASACRAAERMMSYQSLNLSEHQGEHTALARWARTQTPSGTDLRWWETAAGAGSSVGVFVLIAVAARSAVGVDEAAAMEEAYFPWIGSLHLLLDGLVDREEDAAAGQRCLLDYYASHEEAAARMGVIATEARRRIRALPPEQQQQHSLLLAGMASHYLSAREATLPEALLASRSVLAAIGWLAAPAMLVMGVRRAAERG